MTSIERSNERGMAMIIALFMVLAMSIIGTTLMFTSQTETKSSMNYRLMSQARYGAESGIHMAANYLMSNAYGNLLPGSPSDPLPGQYSMLTSPVYYPVGTQNPIVLSSDPAVTQNYPVAAVKVAFAQGTKGTLDAQNGTISYTTTARLLSMQQIYDQYSLKFNTLQTWQITAKGTVSGAETAEVEVSAIVERQPWSIYSYAAFATSNQCAALSFDGGATTDSYDSSKMNPANPVPVIGEYDGNVGTNGNLTEVGSDTIINGSMSTPRSGVGACSSSNVTAETLKQATVSDGLTQLSQEIKFPTPVIPDLTLNPTPNQNFTGGCPGGVPYCTMINVPGPPARSYADITPPPGTTSTNPLELGNVSVKSNTTIHLNAGTYLVNSIDIEGGSHIVIDSGPVVFLVKGNDVTTPIYIGGDGITNPTYVPSNLEFQYAGTKNINITGGTETAALFYAPNAEGQIGGSSDLYGSIVVKQMLATGGAAIHYDRHLERTALTAGNYMMSAFNWENFTN